MGLTWEWTRHFCPIFLNHWIWSHAEEARKVSWLRAQEKIGLVTRRSVPVSSSGHWILISLFLPHAEPIVSLSKGDNPKSQTVLASSSESRISEHCKVLIKLGCGASGDLQREEVTYVFLLCTPFPLSRQWSSNVQPKAFVWRRAEGETAAPGPAFFWNPPDQALWKALSCPQGRWLGRTQGPVWEEPPVPHPLWPSVHPLGVSPFAVFLQGHLWSGHGRNTFSLGAW